MPHCLSSFKAEGAECLVVMLWQVDHVHRILTLLSYVGLEVTPYPLKHLKNTANVKR
jgi:hypothetical protein